MDILPMLLAAIVGTGVPVDTLYAGMIAESELEPRAERWGRQTETALSYIQADDMQALQWLLDSVWPDVSFGYSQRIVKYHWAGDKTQTVKNVMAVRQAVFDDPEKDLRQMALHLDWCRTQTEKRPLDRVNGDRELGALVCYNAGHYPSLHSNWWTTYGAHVSRYQAALDQARTELAEPPIP